MNPIEFIGHVRDKKTGEKLGFKGLWMDAKEMCRYFLDGGLVVVDYRVNTKEEEA